MKLISSKQIKKKVTTNRTFIKLCYFKNRFEYSLEQLLFNVLNVQHDMLFSIFRIEDKVLFF
jgi:hypothetical protein